MPSMFAKSGRGQVNPETIFANDETPRNTASATYQDVVSVNIGTASVEKTFDIDWSCEAYITGTVNEVQVRVYNVTDATTLAEGQLATPNATISQDYHFMGGIDQLIVTGVKNIKIQYRAVSGGTAFIRRTRFRAKQVL